MTATSFRLNTDQESFHQALHAFFEKLITPEARRKKIESVSSDGELLRSDFYRQIFDYGLFNFFRAPVEYGSSFRDLVSVAHLSGLFLIPESLVDLLFAGPFFVGNLLPKAVQLTHAELLSKIGGTDLAAEKFISFAPVVNNTHQLAIPFDYVPEGNQVSFLLHPKSSGKLALSKADAVNAKLRTSSIDNSQKRYAIAKTETEILECSPEVCELFYAYSRILLAAEILGAIERSRDLTVEYVKTRKQFGVAVGSFQAVQHALADMQVDSESLRALVQFASWAAVASPTQLPLVSRSAFYHACEIGPRTIEKAIQLHGGIGFTWEYDLHFYLRRVKSIELVHGPKHGDFAALSGFIS